MKKVRLFNEFLNEGTYDSPEHIGSTSDGQGSNAEIYKRKKGYYVVVSGEYDYDFEAKNDKELITKLKDNEFYDTSDILESVNEIRSSQVSGTMAGWIDSLEDRKYELKKDVKGAQIGDFINVVLPKGTIIYNLPGGVFADHFSLKNKYASKSSRGPQYFEKPTFSGIMIKQKPDTLAAIEKNSKVLESVVTEKKYDQKSLMKAMRKDDGMIQLSNGEEYVIYAYGNGNDDNDDMWKDKSIFALDQDGEEHEIEYSDIVRYDESIVTEKLARGLKPLLKIGLDITKKTGEDALLDLSDKFDSIDDEYAGDIASHLDMAIELMQDGYAADATRKLKQFNKACKDVLGGKEIGSAFESLNEGKIKYKKGKSWQSEEAWTVQVDSNSSMCDISVNSQAGWRLDPHDNREETWQLLDGGRRRATIYFRSGDIDKFAKQMFDLNDETAWGNKTKLTAKDYGDIIRVWIDMKSDKSNESIVNEDATKIAELGGKIRDLDKKVTELKAKAIETVVKMRDEEDPLKSELLNLGKQKLVLKAELTKLEIKTTGIKIKQEANK